jgi:hypothetical protein
MYVDSNGYSMVVITENGDVIYQRDANTNISFSI